MSSVKRVIDRWDPIELLRFCPQDEYDIEIQKIESFLCDRIEDLGDKIYGVFLDSFGPDVFSKTRKECHEVAKAILLCDEKTCENI